MTRPRTLPMPIAFAALSLIAVAFAASRAARADDISQEKAQARKERYTNWMTKYAEGTQIELVDAGGADRQAIEFVAKPVFRYSDEQRAIPDATLWVWTSQGSPVALQKVEGNNHGGGQMWTICFASLSEGLLTVEWPGGRRYAAKTPGIKYKPIPQAEAPAESSRQRALQLKSLKERFSGELGFDGEGKNGAETRTMPKPIYEYADPESKLPRGAIFGMTSTGTNPDLLLIIEARPDADGKLLWQYAHARMTSNSLRVRLDNEDVWGESGVSSAAFENWIFYFLPREFP